MDRNIASEEFNAPEPEIQNTPSLDGRRWAAPSRASGAEGHSASISATMWSDTAKSLTQQTRERQWENYSIWHVLLVCLENSFPLIF